MAVTYVAAAERYDRLQYRRCGRSGLLLPALSLGLWQNFGGERPLEDSRAILRRAFDLGITHFDLANNYGPPYGSAEETFGRIMRDDLRPYRDELVVSTKAGYDMWPGPYGEWGSRKYLLASLDQSLRRLDLEYVDIVFSPLAQGMLSDKYLEGIPEGSRASRNGSLSPRMITDETVAKLHGLSHVAKSRGQTLAQMALAWTLRDPRVTSTLVGVSSMEQLEANVAALDNLELSDDELIEIDRHATDSGINLWA